MNALQTDKILYFAEFHFNLFHADLICRAIQDDDLSFDVFMDGIDEIREAEKDDKDEYIPKGWEEV